VRLKQWEDRRDDLEVGCSRFRLQCQAQHCCIEAGIVLYCWDRPRLLEELVLVLGGWSVSREGAIPHACGGLQRTGPQLEVNASSIPNSTLFSIVP
jgi:hypothetical protein